MRILQTLFTVVLALIWSNIAFGQCADDPRENNQIIVRITEGAAVEDFISAFEAAHDDLGILLEVTDAVESWDLYLLEMTPSDLSDAIIDLLEIEIENGIYADLEWGEFLYEVQTAEGRTGSLWFYIPPVNNGLYYSQYGLDQIGIPASQKLALGAGTAVAILDTGIDASHPVLNGMVLSNGFNFITGTNETSDVGDGDMVGHGTYVSGIVALVSPGTKLLPVVVLDPDGKSDIWTVTKGLFYAIDKGVEVINASFGTSYRSNGIEYAIDEAMKMGIVVVGAVGNQNGDCREQPAHTSNAFGVAAVDDQDIKADFSNWEDKTFISAPGDSKPIGGKGGFDPDRSIISILPDGDYAYWEGTSMAVPFVSGAVALVRSQHPEWDPHDQPPPPKGHEEEWGPIYYSVETLIAATAVDIDDLNPEYEGMLGEGRIDIEAAVTSGPVAPKLGDLDGNGSVSTTDLLNLLSKWGIVHTSADLDVNGIVSVGDLLILLSNWG